MRVNQPKTSHLKPYQFKPGESGNPKGRPREKLSKTERLTILSEIAKHKIEADVSAGHIIAAIKEANLMEGIYAQVQLEDNRTVNILVIDGETKDLISKVKDRTRKLIDDATEQGKR